MGPHSAVKWMFIVEIQVIRRDSTQEKDLYRAYVQYRPDILTFLVRSESVETTEMRKKTLENRLREKSASEAIVQKLREKLENREAIYVEKGALRVRVTNIRPGDGISIKADIEEVPTKGFERLRLQYCNVSDGMAPLRWTVGGAGSELTFSDHKLSAGPYCGWSLYFGPQLVQGVVEMASRWRFYNGFQARYIVSFVSWANTFSSTI